MIKRICSNCRFWEKEGKDSDDGVCRRYAPRTFQRPQGAEDFSSYPFWPLTYFDEWCGEWQPQECQR